jgi:outer membrane protein assembly factor BamB
MIGSGDGNLYDLAISNGSVVWILPIHHPIIGVAAVKSVVIFDTSSGLIGAARSWTSRQGLWYFETSAGITSPPAIVDATVYVGAGDGDLYAFTTYGHLPR